MTETIRLVVPFEYGPHGNHWNFFFLRERRGVEDPTPLSELKAVCRTENRPLFMDGHGGNRAQDYCDWLAAETVASREYAEYGASSMTAQERALHVAELNRLSRENAARKRGLDPAEDGPRKAAKVSKADTAKATEAPEGSQQQPAAKSKGKMKKKKQ